MINNNLYYEKNSHAKAATTTTDMVALSKATPTTSSDNNMTTTNGNSYFNRFDNRIAANLAAVINGARFRSSSCSKTSRKSVNNAPHINTKATINPSNTTNTNKIIHSNSTRVNANNSVSVSYSSINLHLNNDTSNIVGDADCSSSSRSSLNRHQQYHFNSAFTTLGGAMRQQAPSKHLQLNNVTDDDIHLCPNSPLFRYNSNDVGSSSAASNGRRRPSYLFSQVNLNCNDNEKDGPTPSSDEDNSPTELNNCKRLVDKPPLVKRLTMGLLRSHEESRPLVNAAVPAIAANELTTTLTKTTTSSSPKANASSLSNKHAVYSYGYINDEAFEPEKFIASKFGDSCRQSLTAIPMLDTINLNDNSEFNLKKRFLRETSSANSSPKIFANRLRGNTTSTGLYNNTVSGYAPRNNVNSSMAFAIDDEETELRDVCWFQAGISREIAAEVLSSKNPGAFLVRKSSSKSGCLALTLRVPSPPGPKIANYVILRTSCGYKISGSRKEFSSLKALITHHSVMPELLPIPLAMPRPTNMTSSRRNLDDFDTYDSLQMLLKYLRAKNLENGE